MEQIKFFKAALRTEAIKMKNTLGIWTVIIFPAFIVFMNFMIFLNRPKMLLGPGVNPWVSMSRNAVMVYSILFLPLFIAIITFYVNFNEHKSNAWRQIYALPVSKSSVYFSKFIVSFILVCVSMLFFYLINYFSMMILKTAKPEIPFDQFGFDSIIYITFIKITLTAAGISAIQFAASILFQNFLYPLGFGLIATFAGAFLSSWEKIIYYPYSYPFQAVMEMMKNNYSIFNQNMAFSFIVACVFVVAGYVVHFRMRIK